MTTEETELTFIRCPNCRSLVPAVATRCRMCGYNFESAAETVPQAGADPGKAKSRVRQRTISATAGEVDDFSPHGEGEPSQSTPPFAGYGQSVDSQPQDSAFPLEEPPAPSAHRVPESLFIPDDTLEQFSVVEQDESRTESRKESAPRNYREAELSGGDDLFEADVELQIRGDVVSRGSESSEQRPSEGQAWDDDEPLPDPMHRESPPSEDDDVIDADLSFDGGTESEPDQVEAHVTPVGKDFEDRDDSAFDSADDEEDEDESDTTDDLGSSSALHEVVGEGGTRKRRRRRRRRRGGAAQAAAQEATQLEASTSESVRADSSSAESIQEEPAQAASDPVPPVFQSVEAKRTSVEPDSAVDSFRAQDRKPKESARTGADVQPETPREFSRPETPTYRTEPTNRDIPANQGGAPMTTADVASPRSNGSVQSATGPAVLSDRDIGMLVGWMVTYGSDPKGNSLEIRGGRFFIGGQRLRETDIVIADRGLSAPHCLVAAVPGGGLRVQDLMSEGGTFIKRSGANTFERVNDVVVVEHGDSLRFGDYEVRICLMP